MFRTRRLSIPLALILVPACIMVGHFILRTVLSSQTTLGGQEVAHQVVSPRFEPAPKKEQRKKPASDFMQTTFGQVGSLPAAPTDPPRVVFENPQIKQMVRKELERRVGDLIATVPVPAPTIDLPPPPVHAAVPPPSTINDPAPLAPLPLKPQPPTPVEFPTPPVPPPAPLTPLLGTPPVANWTAAASTPVAKPATAAASSPWTLQLAIQGGKSILTAKAGKDVEFKVTCDRLELQTPRGNILAQGDVKIVSNGIVGSSDRLTIHLQEDNVVLEGKAQLKCQREAQELEMKGELLSLRIRAGAPSAIQPALFWVPLFR